MKREWVILFLLLAMCVTVAAALLTPEPVGGHGVPHGGFTAMLKGSPTPLAERVTFLGWTFGVLQIVFFVTCMTLGLSRMRPTTERQAGRGLLMVLFAVGSLLYLSVWTEIVLADRTATMSGEVRFLGSFPAATSWMLFGLSAVPLIFVAAYVIGFSRWILPPESLARFEALVAAETASSGLSGKHSSTKNNTTE